MHGLDARPRRRPTRPRRPRRSPSPAPGADLADGTARHHHRDRSRHRRRRGRRRRGLHRRRHDLAPGTRHDAAGPTPGSPTAARPRRSRPGPSTTAATSRPRRRASTVNVTCPCSIWGTGVDARQRLTPATPAAIEVGVKFRSDASGIVTGIRFYKASTNTGTHVGNLWTANGPAARHGDVHRRDRLRLAAGRLRARRWRSTRTPPTSRPTSRPTGTTRRTAPTSIRPPVGPAPTITNVDSPPLHALRNTNGVVNGVYSFSGTSIFPTSSS